MRITPLYELLIFIEDRKSVGYNEMSFFNPAVLRGILGKMEAMKLVEKNLDKYSISKKGQAALNEILDNLHQSTLHWDNKWRFISFSIPESKRSLRDKFRRYLESRGVRMIMSGLWITPLDIKKDIIEEAKKANIYECLIIVESDSISSGLSKESFQKLWNFDSSKREIYNFIDSAERYIKDKDKTSYDTKKIIFQYASILSNQPQLPIELFPADWPQFRANLTYKKIRRLLT